MKAKSASRRKPWLRLVLIAVVCILLTWVAATGIKRLVDVDADKRKFAGLESRMNAVLNDFKSIAPQGKWTLQKSCSRTGGKFASQDDQKFCNLSVSSQEKLPYRFEQFVGVVRSKGFASSGMFYDEKTGRYMEEFKDTAGNANCILRSSSNDLASVVQPVFNCYADALIYHYPNAR